MCGRFESVANAEGLVKQLEQLNIELIFEKDDSIKTINIAPTEKITGIRKQKDKYLLSSYNWGIKFSQASPLIFNSRIETIITKKFWKDSFNRNRCLIPVSAFYEWKKEDGRKVPYRIFLEPYDLFFIPALYYINNENSFSASLITTTPNEFIKPIHHRMPVIFTFSNAVSFLTNTLEENLKLCIPFPNPELMRMEKVNYLFSK
jgi:putative SOS response-associated peptidase YedK